MAPLSSRSLLILIGFGIAIRLSVMIYVGTSAEKVLTGDGKEFQQIGINIAEHFSFSKSINDPSIPDTRRTPVYPFWIALWAALTGPDFHPLFVTLTHLFFFLIAAVMIWKTGKIMFDKSIAAVALGIYCFDISSIASSSFLMAETLYSMFCILLVYFLVIYVNKLNSIYLIFAGLTLGLMTLTKPMSVYFVLFIFPVVLYFIIRYKFQRKILLISYVAFLIVFTLTITPWVIRNYYKTGIIQVSSIQDYQLLYYQAAIVKADAENITRSAAVEKIRAEINEREDIFEHDIVTAERQSVYRQKALDIISSHWVVYIKHFLLSKILVFVDPDRFSLAAILENETTLGLHNSFGQSSGIKDGITALLNNKKLFMILIINFILLSTVLAGAVKTITLLKKNPQWVPAFYIILYIIILHLFMIGVTPWARFRVMYYPLMSVLAAPGLYLLYNHVKIAIHKKFRAD